VWPLLPLTWSLWLVAPPQAVEGSFWELSPSAAIDDARNKHRWVLLYFPSPKDDRDPPQIRDAALLARLSRRAVGARARSREVRALVKRYRVEKLPAVVFLDPFGNPVGRLEEKWSGRDMVSRLSNLDRQLESLLEHLDRMTLQAEKSLKNNEISRATGISRKILEHSREGFPQRARAHEVLDSVLELGERSLIKILAQEGLVPDRQLIQELSHLEERFSQLESFQARLSKERNRLRTRKIGGR
jgi:hypothetical protein